jgi:hypothetical protein
MISKPMNVLTSTILESKRVLIPTISESKRVLIPTISESKGVLILGSRNALTPPSNEGHEVSPSIRMSKRRTIREIFAEGTRNIED